MRRDDQRPTIISDHRCRGEAFAAINGEVSILPVIRNGPRLARSMVANASPLRHASFSMHAPNEIIVFNRTCAKHYRHKPSSQAGALFVQ